MKRLGILLAAIGVTGATGMVAWAQNAEPLDRNAASMLASACFNCHGPEGVAPGPIPSIAGMPADQMIAMLNAFKADEVPGATIMGRIARGYDDAEIAAIAAYFAGDFN